MTEKHTFYIPRVGFEGEGVRFPEAEGRHAARVLRLQPDSEVQVVDGEGGRFLVRLGAVSRHGVTGTVVERLGGEPDIRPRITLAVGLLKHSGRYETMLEKAAELGVERIVPLVTRRTETARLRMDRAEAILVAAMKQCGRARLVTLDAPTPLAEFLGGVSSGVRLVCHEATDPSRGLAARLGPAESVCVLVGPEGGFTDEEVVAAGEVGFAAVSLGPTRLRTETAAIAAAAAILIGCNHYQTPGPE